MENNNQKSQQGYKGLVRGGTLVGVFALSLTCVHTASAFSMTDVVNFVKNLGIETLLGQTTDEQTSAVITTTNQTALSAAVLSNAIQRNQELNEGVKQGVAIGEKIVSISKDKEIGKGLPSSIGCQSVADKQVANTRSIITDETIVAQTSAVSASHFVSDDEKRAARTYDHLENYCDVSETTLGLCIPQPNGLSSADTNYGIWETKSLLDKDQISAAQAYMFNSVDPANTLDSQCTSSLCEQLQTTERGFNALASMVHGAYSSQINDRTILDVAPDVKSVITDTIAASNPAATGPTVMPGSSVSSAPVSAPASTPASPTTDGSCDFNPKAAAVGIKHYKFPEASQSELATYKPGLDVHKDALDPLKRMVAAAQAQGVTLTVGSAFRSVAKQGSIVQAKKSAGQNDKQIYFVSSPAGYSEHHTGFAVDFTPIEHTFANTAAYKWLNQHASEYGFSRTFTPQYATATGVSQEEWHWKYTQSPRAQQMLANSQCMGRGQPK